MYILTTFILFCLTLYFKTKSNNSAIRLTRLEEANSASLKQVAEMGQRLEESSEKVKKFDEIINYQNELTRLKSENDVATNELKLAEKKLQPFREYQELIDSGFYRFKYSFEDVDKYSDALAVNKAAQKIMLSQKKAITTHVNELEETNIFKQASKLALLALNSEFDIIATKVNVNNFDSCKEKVTELYETINELIAPLQMKIDNNFLNLKQQELAISYEYELEKKKIKEEQAQLIAQMKEEEDARDEAETLREKAIQEEEKYSEALEAAKTELLKKSDDEKEAMEIKIKELESKLILAHAERERATSLAQITKAGHIYIISNIGSFGENVYKIGMTRRAEPVDRIKELSDASVPFSFDIHAIVKCEDAPHLENTLHKHFDEKRMNKINNRKEFFRVNIQEIESACNELGLKVKLTKSAEAREYRDSIDLNKVKTAA